jgi:hypothetical protein
MNQHEMLKIEMNGKCNAVSLFGVAPSLLIMVYSWLTRYIYIPFLSLSSIYANLRIGLTEQTNIIWENIF